MCGGGGSRRPTGSRSQSSGQGQQSSDTETETAVDGTEDPCNINERTDLTGTDIEVLDDVNIGDIYPVEDRDGRICVVDFDEQVIGSILGQLGTRLENCMEGGREYRAEIVEIEGQNCNVRITDKCTINAEAMVASPDPDVLADVSKGDKLNVEVREDSLCVIDGLDRTLGSLAEAWTGVLIECLESGWEYEAEVKEIDRGKCTVQVSSTPPDK